MFIGKYTIASSQNVAQMPKNAKYIINTVVFTTANGKFILFALAQKNTQITPHKPDIKFMIASH